MKKLLLLFICLPFVIWAQNTRIDSLKLALKNAKHDTTRCNIINALVEITPDGEWEKYNEQLEKLSYKNYIALQNSNPLKKVYLKHYADATVSSTYLAEQNGEIPLAIELYKKSILLTTELGNKDRIGSLFNTLGILYSNRGEVNNSLECYFKSLKIRESLKDQKGVAQTLANIGIVYTSQKDLSTAIEYFEKSAKIRNDINDQAGLSYSLNNLGHAYQSQGNNEKALSYYLQSLKIQESFGDKLGMALSYNNVGGIYQSAGDPNIKDSKKKSRISGASKALEYFKKSLSLNEQLKSKKGIALALTNMSVVLDMLNKTEEAIEKAKQSLQLSKEIGYPEQILFAARALSKYYIYKKDWKNGLKNYELYIAMRDSIVSEGNKKASIKNQLKYEYEKKAAADSVKNAEEQKVKDAQLVAQNASLKSEKTQRYALYGGLVLVIGFLAFVFNRFRVTNKQKKIIEEQKIVVDQAFEKLAEKNKEVLDSIYYARRIQQALITSERYIERNLKNLKQN